MNSLMEQQTRYLMWTRRKLSERPLLDSLAPIIAAGSSYNDSWEERAFAEDSAGLLGGCVWPPRSYSCSFCRREFRSAQALGGHMNVHRRDRARLRESSSRIGESNNSLKPPQVSTLVYTPNPNPSSDHVASSLSHSRLSVESIQENRCQNTLLSPCYSSSIIQGSLKESLFSPLGSDTNLIPVKTSNNLELWNEGKNWRSWAVDDDDDDDDDNCEMVSFKRRRTDLLLPSLLKPCARNQKQVQSELLIQLEPNLVEELDLELRLGDAPKVK